MKNLPILNKKFPKAFLIAFLLINHLFSAQSITKTYATSESHSFSTVCLGCEIKNPQNAVGNNEGDYSTLKIGVGLTGNISQTLKFPTTSFKKVSIKIAVNPNDQLSISLLNSIKVETMNGNTANGDSQTLDEDILKINPQEPYSGLIEFTPTKPYDRVRIDFNAGLLTLNSELHIYYALQSSYTTPCATFPIIPDNYYSFDGNQKDAIEGHDLLGSVEFENSNICGSAITAARTSTEPYILPIPEKSMKYEQTISFWAKTDDLLGLTMAVNDTEIQIKTDSIIINQSSGAQSTAIFTGNFSSQRFEHYSITTLPKYRNTEEGAGCIGAGGSLEGCSKPIRSQITLYKNGKFIGSKQIDSQPDIYTPIPNKSISIQSIGSALDDLLIYNKILPETILKQMPCYYNLPGLSCTNNILTSNPIAKDTTSEDTFSVSPNPTTGQITLSGNVTLEGSDIFISNTSGKEVYRSKLTTKTLNLPATLPGGVYMVTLQTQDGKAMTRKVILTR